MKRFVLVLIALIAILGFSSLFYVNEGERGIVIRFGKVAHDTEGKALVYQPGLHLKLPFIERIIKLDARIKTLDGHADRYITSEKKDLIVDTYAKWRIEDFEKYFLSTGGGNQRQAEDLLARRINSGLRAEFGTRTIRDIVSGRRDEVMEQALIQASESSNDLGIQVIDVRVKKINLPDEVSTAIFDRMVAERQAVAREHRSQGREQAEIIRADIDARVTVMLADAQREARQTRGEGDAEAAEIYAKTYNQDPEFFAFIRSLESYTNSFGEGNNMLVIGPDSEYFKYFKSLQAKGNK